MLNNIRKNLMQAIFMLTCLYLSKVLVAQTNPTPQSIPYSENFTSLVATSTTYPAGWQGWTLAAAAPTAAHLNTAPTADRTLTASGTAASTGGNVYNYNGKLGFLSTGSLTPTAVFSINSTGKQSIVVNYDMMLIRNPFDGTTANNRVLEAVLQYRIGNTGSFTTVTGTEYVSNTTLQTTTTTNPLNSIPIATTLPSACNNQPEVQLRWSIRQSAGSAGARPSFAVDNVSVTGTTIPDPAILTNGTITAMSTTAGVASTEQSFTVSGSNLTGVILISAPTGFEVSQSASSGYNTTLTLNQNAGSVSSTLVYVRIASTSAAGNYAGDITISSSGATNQLVSIPTSSVIAPTGQSQFITFTFTGSPTYGNSPIVLNGVASSGLAVSYSSSNNSVVQISGGNLVIVGAGTSIVTASQSGNASYNPAADVSQTITVSPATLTMDSPAVTDKVYDGTNAAVITGTLSGIIGSDDVSFLGTGTFASTAVGSNIAVTSTSTLAGAQAGNYTLVQPTGLTGNIIGGVQTINFSALPQYSTATATLTLAATSSATGATITYASSNTAVATVSGNVVTIVGAGTTNITASSAAFGNFASANDVVQSLNVINALLAWDFTGVSNAATSNPTYVVSGLGLASASPMTRGTGAAASAGANSFRTTGFQNNGIALTNTDYFQWTISPQVGTAVSLNSIDARFVGTASFYAAPGVTSQFAYSTDGTSFTLIGSPVQSTSLTMSQVDLSGVTALQNIQPGTIVTIRYYASGQTTTGGWGFSSPSAGVMGLILGGTTTALPCPFYQDNDGDGYGNPSVSINATCGSSQVGYVELINTDCNDNSNAIKPGATELPCNAADDNCNGSTDENFVAGCNDPAACNYIATATCSATCDYTQQTYYQDLDADGYGNSTITQLSCSAPSGYVLVGGDCDELSAVINPGASEILCNSIDDNCNSVVDEGSVSGCSDPNANNYNAAANCSGTCQYTDFVPGNVVALRMGSGSGALSSAGTAVFLEEMSASGIVSTVALPTTGANRMVLHGSSSAEAQMTRSSDGTLLVLPGYDAAVGTASINTTTAVTAPRVVSTIGLNAGTFSRQVSSTTILSGQNFRSAATNGINYWGVGSSGGVNYFGPSASAAVSTTSANNRVVNVYNGNLYFSTGSGTRGIYKVGSGLPITSGATSVIEIATGASSSPYAFQFSLDGNTCYVADDNTSGSGGVQKYIKNNNIWSLAYTITLGTASGARAIAVDFYAAAEPRVYAVKNDAAGTYVVYFNDNGTSTPTINTVATALVASNKAYRSIAFAPCTPSTWYADADGDGYGALANTLSYCTQPYGYVSNSTDCDDAVSASNPAASEICDGVDNDCTGGVDNGLTFVNYYSDADADGYGAGTATSACSAPANMVTSSNDCNDGDASINPIGTEICGNTVDEDCSGADLTCPVSGIGAAVNVLNIAQFGTGVQNSQTINLNLGSNSIESPGIGNDLWYSFVAQNNAIRISLSGSSSVNDDNDLSLYNNPTTTGVQLVPLVTENDVHPGATGAAADGGSEILYYSNLVPGSTYFLCVRNNNSTPGTCGLTIGYLRGSQIDIGPYTGGTGVYSNTCQNFKAAFRPNGSNYTVKRWADMSASGSPAWTYTIPGTSTICQLGRILPANLSPTQVNYPVTVDVTYNLPDAFGNLNTVIAKGNIVGSVGLSTEPSLIIRATDMCPVFKSATTGTIATNRSVCGTDVYEWQFTEANALGVPTGLPNANPIYGPSGASRILALSSVPGMANAKFYNVRIRSKHVDGASLSSWGNTSCVKTIGAAGMAVENNDVISNTLSNGAEVVLFPNPNNGQGVNLQINGMDGDVMVRVSDANGKCIHTERYFVEGALTTTMNFYQTLSSGLYQVELINAGNRDTIRMSVVR